MIPFKQLFGHMQCAVIGMIHIRALPGSPLNNQSINEINDIACKEMEIYCKLGVDAVLLENMHDLPYVQSDKMGPETTAYMSKICSNAKKLAKNIPCGVQILASCNDAALAVASAAELQFIRVEGFVYSHIADEGPTHACAGSLLRYRKQLKAEHIKIFTDIKKKHSSHSLTQDVSLSTTAQTAEFFLSDGIVLTGQSTGLPTNPEELQEAKNAVDLPVLIGSGINIENVHQYINANGFIIGSHFKNKNKWNEELNEKLPVLI
uniref:BtpA family membrane complex biogenesis protein n=1 Tax=Strigamia maritima TaxID=126957 RepID=T1J297_STRMM